MEMGMKIKALRAKKGVTQETMAEALGVSFQAVSKWENNLTMPDISLLPALSVYLGVTIDDLFEMTDDSRYDRIDHMLEQERVLSEEDFRYCENFLMEQMKKKPGEGKPYRFLAELHHHRAQSEKELAAEYAKMALAREPEEIDSHRILMFSMNVPASDWCAANHQDYIEFYKKFVRENRNYRPGYLLLINALLADRRLTEAEEVVKELSRRFSGVRVKQYAGLLELTKGNETEAKRIWSEMLAEGKESQDEYWLTLFMMAEDHARMEEYDEAIRYYDESFKVQKAPRMWDALQAEACIYEIQGKLPEAIQCYDRAIDVLKDEWKITFGEEIDQPIREKKRLEQKLYQKK